jgi:hypothetical protein
LNRIRRLRVRVAECLAGGAWLQVFLSRAREERKSASNFTGEFLTQGAAELAVACFVVEVGENDAVFLGWWSALMRTIVESAGATQAINLTLS